MTPGCRLGAAAVLGLALAVTAGCEDPTGPRGERVLGTLVYEDGEPLVSIPETVDAGAPFTVSATTFWIDTCVALDETEVRATSTRVDIFPWDRVTEDGACGDAPTRVEHAVRLSRASPATLTVVVHGRRLVDGEREAVTVARQLVVRAP